MRAWRGRGAAAAVDFDARINAFVEAVSDRTEPDLNRILADGARVLRLRRAGAKVSKDDATALLVAAVYMGFDDVANLALVLRLFRDRPRKRTCFATRRTTTTTRNNTMQQLHTPPKLGAWTLRAILDGRTFIVPDYQRGYAWSNRGNNRQLADFWDDLEGTDATHYMGALVVEASGDLFEVVDGQQRLTTLAILLSVLDSASASWLRYGEGNADRGVLASVLASGDPGMAPKTANAYQRNLLDARAFFEKRTRSLDAAGKAALRDKCLDRLVFNISVLGRELDSGVVFETMNNRGKPLTILEKLKNRLMYLTEIAAAAEPPEEVGDNPDNEPDTPDSRAADLRMTIAAAWGDIYRDLGSNPDLEPLDEDEFLAAHLSLYRRPKESTYSPAVAESRLFKMFCPNPERHPLSERVDERNPDAMRRVRDDMEPSLSIAKIEDYVGDLRSFAAVWAKIHSESDTPCGRCRLLSGTREVKAFLAAVAGRVADEPLRDRIAETAESVLFRNTIRSVLDEGFLTTLGRRLYGKCPERARGQGPVDGNGVLATLAESLEEENRAIDANDLVRVFSERMDRSQSPFGFYGWSGLKYFLFTQEGPDGFPWRRYEDASLEHVVPQSATDDRYAGWWKRQIEEFAPDSAPERWAALDSEQKKDCRKRKRALVNTLGNFVLLSQSDNASVSDDPWERYEAVEGVHAAVLGKKAFYREHGKNGGATEVAATPGSWNAFRIRERGRRLFARLAEKLGVTGLDQEGIDTALGFRRDEPLSDTQFAPLPEADVAALAPRFLPARDGTEESRTKPVRRTSAANGPIASALDAMSACLRIPADFHNSQFCLGKTPEGALLLRFTKNNPHAVWNFWVDDKQAFADHHADALSAWAAEQGLGTKLGRDHKPGNGIQFRPAPVNLEAVDCDALKRTGDRVLEELKALS